MYVPRETGKRGSGAVLFHVKQIRSTRDVHSSLTEGHVLEIGWRSPVYVPRETGKQGSGAVLLFHVKQIRST
jgi:hypothetical protein